MSKLAPLNARELAALRSRLRSAGIHSDFDHGELDGTAMNFVYNANAIPLPRYAGLFQHRIDVIEIFEEARFLGRALRINRQSNGEFATLMVSEHIALSPEIAVSDEQAIKVVECLA